MRPCRFGLLVAALVAVAVPASAQMRLEAPPAAGGSTYTGTANQVIVTGTVLSTPQDIGAASTPRFGALGLGIAAGASGITFSDATVQTTAASGVVTSITGTVGQIAVGGTAAVPILSTPQDIATRSTPQFARLGLGAAADATAQLNVVGGSIKIDTGLASNARRALDWNISGNGNGVPVTGGTTSLGDKFVFYSSGSRVAIGIDSSARLWQQSIGGSTGGFEWWTGATPTSRMVLDDTNGLTVKVPVVAPILQGSGTGVSVANVGATSCGTTAATIAGNQLSGVVTTGATGATQCRVTFSTAAPVARDCVANSSSTVFAIQSTVASTTATDFTATFPAGATFTYVCHPR